MLKHQNPTPLAQSGVEEQHKFFNKKGHKVWLNCNTVIQLLQNEEEV